jgi:glycosyltransferase involved in cell wall biosynthesis
MKLLHAIHDYLPAHRSGSEIYAHALGGALRARGHEVEIVCAETDLGVASGAVRRREVDGIPITELVNNWEVSSFAESYRPRALAGPLRELLRRFRPDVVHVHSLLNLSFDLPAMARREGAAVVATLHDFTLVCASGGQRVHVAERHVCHEIDTDRCARCFRDSPFHSLMAARSSGGGQATRFLARWLGRRSGAPGVAPADLAERLRQVPIVAREIDCFVAPSRSLAADLARFGVPAAKIEISDYGFEPLATVARPGSTEELRIGFVGTLVWHKGAHVLVEALRRLPAGRFRATLHGNLDWYPDYVRALREASRGLPVEFPGSFGAGELPRVLADLDVLVVPSLWPENSPLVIHEAFQAGVPVIGARTGGVPELVSDGVNGLVYEPDSAAGLATALGRLVADRELLARFGAALPEVKSIAADSEEWEERYRRVLRDRASR